MTRQEQRTAKEQKAADTFNEKHPTGTMVRYWTMVRGDESGGTAKTRTPAQVLSGHIAVVWVEGYGACIALTHVEPRLG